MNENITEIEIPLGQPIDVVAIAVKNSAIRCKILSTQQPITFRTVRDEVEGEILTIIPSKVWRFKKTLYMSGEVESKRIDIPAINFESLALEDKWEWNPDEEYWGEEDDPLDKYFEPIKKFGKRDSYEMEQILPFQDPEDYYNDPILDAAEFYESGNHEDAYKIMENILSADLRCLDAHAHLGNWMYNRFDKTYEMTIEKALRHYEVGVKIGELSLGNNFNGLLPWGRINNRPFLRCLYGYGLSSWRLGKTDEARKVFERMLWLNPTDNQGIRFILDDIDNGLTWEGNNQK